MMAHPRHDNALLMRRIHKQLEKQHDDLREAVGVALDYRRRLPYADYLVDHPGLDRDAMLVALLQQFQETGLGGLKLCEASGFPTRLWFENDDVILMVRRRKGFRNSPAEASDQPLIENKRRIVLFCEFPKPDTDSLATFSLHLFDGEGPLEEAMKLSQEIDLLTPNEKITENKFYPTLADEQGFNFGT